MSNPFKFLFNFKRTKMEDEKQGRDSKKYWGWVALMLLAPFALVFYWWAADALNLPIFFRYAILTLYAIFYLSLIYGYFKVGQDDKKKDFTNTESTNNRSRSYITLWFVTAGLLIILILGILVYLTSKDDVEGAKWVFNGTVPLLASWIGTILAFYFGRENMQAATESVLALTKDKIDDIIQVKNMMITTETMVYLKVNKSNEILSQIDGKPLTANEQALGAVLKSFQEVGKNRIPVLSDKLTPISVIDIEHLEKADQTKDLATFLKNHPDQFGNEKLNGFKTVSPDTTLGNAILLFGGSKSCRNVFVTDNGEPDGRVQGWVTDKLADRLLKLELIKKSN